MSCVAEQSMSLVEKIAEWRRQRKMQSKESTFEHQNHDDSLKPEEIIVDESFWDLNESSFERSFIYQPLIQREEHIPNINKSPMKFWSFTPEK